MAGGGSNKAVVTALCANAAIAVAKFVTFLVTASASMLAESVHSLADTSNQGLLLFGGRRAQREATPEHPFGYGRVRYFWSFVVALVLFSLGGLFALYEGIEKLREPHEVTSVGWAIGVLLVAIVFESYALRTAVVAANEIRGSQSWVGFVRHAKSPELPVVLLEDIGALVGLVFALLGVGLTLLTGEPMWDGIATISIGLLLIAIAIILAIEMKSLLIGESASRSDLARIEETLLAAPGITRLIHMRTQHVGPDELLVGAKVEFDRHLSLAALGETIDEAERRLREAVPVARMIYLEPDRYDPAEL